MDINGIIGNYSVTCAPPDGGCAGTVVEGSVNEAEITGLLPCQSYNVTVAATTEGGKGPDSDEVEGDTDEGKMILINSY